MVASPQLENGYTRIADELLEAVYTNVINAEFMRALFWIIRITYGFHKKITITNYKSLATALTISPEEARGLLTQMATLNYILFESQTDSSNQCVVGINKNYDEWR